MASNSYSSPLNQRQQALLYKSLSRDGETPVTIVNRNQNVDGSVTPVRFKIQPPTDQNYQLTRMIFLIRDSGSFDSGGWGNNGGSPLPVGMKVGLSIGGVEYDQTPVPWQTMADLAAVAHDVTHHNFGQGAEFLSMRLTFAKAGQNIRLKGSEGDFMYMDVNDDLTYLIEQRVMVQGYIENLYL